MLTLFILLTFILFSNAFYVKRPPVIKNTPLHSHHIKKFIKIFNIIDIIQPNSISKWIQWKLFIKNGYIVFIHNIKEDLYEMNLNFSCDVFIFSSICIFLYYWYNTKNMNKINVFEKEQDTKDCLYNLDVIISFISYFLFKDVLSAC